VAYHEVREPNKSLVQSISFNGGKICVDQSSVRESTGLLDGFGSHPDISSKSDPQAGFFLSLARQQAKSELPFMQMGDHFEAKRIWRVGVEKHFLFL
jgi:hypothetical protein